MPSVSAFPPVFKSFLQAGFECSSHRLKGGRRLDLTASTRHDLLVRQDYRRLLELGIGTVREGLRWHLVEPEMGRYDFSSIVPFLDAAQELEVEQIIDLFHFGWPDFLDVFSSQFVESFAELSFRFASLLKSRGLSSPFLAPTNEISFLSWAGGDTGYMNPFLQNNGGELKRQLVRAAIAASKAILQVLPASRLVWPEPVIHIAGDAEKPGDCDAAEAYRLSMYEAWDMLSGRLCPEIGGSSELLHIIGINFYDRNEWMNHGPTLRRRDQLYRPFHAILQEVWNRYRIPLFVSETGTEDSERPEWFASISEEARHARSLGVPVEGICLYPILNHPGWDDDRHCYNGLFDYAQPNGHRNIYEPLAAEIALQQKANSAVYMS